MLSNKNIIVTGSSSGIGLSITKALLKNKVNVYGISRRNPSFSNKNYHHIQFDLSNIETEHEKLSSVIKEKPISGLISNACLLYTSPSPRDLAQSRMPSSA